MDGQYYNHELSERNRLLEKVARKVFPKFFQDEVEFNEFGKKIKYCMIDEVNIVHEKNLRKYLYADFRVQIDWEQKFIFEFGNWKDVLTEYKSNHTPGLRIVRREVIKKSPYAVGFDTTHFFKANTVLVDRFKYLDWSRSALKTAMFEKDVFLVFTDELK